MSNSQGIVPEQEFVPSTVYLPHGGVMNPLFPEEIAMVDIGSYNIIHKALLAQQQDILDKNPVLGGQLIDRVHAMIKQGLSGLIVVATVPSSGQHTIVWERPAVPMQYQYPLDPTLSHSDKQETISYAFSVQTYQLIYSKGRTAVLLPVLLKKTVSGVGGPSQTCLLKGEASDLCLQDPKEYLASIA